VPSHLHRGIDNLRKHLLAEAALIEEAVQLAVDALVTRDPKVAERVIDGDEAIDEKEVEIEEECLKILALHQPVAVDLRYVIAILKINNDLERIGDLAVNIAQRAIYLARHKQVEVPVDFNAMWRLVRTMVRDSINALVNYDSSMARGVCEMDDEVDAFNRTMYDYVKEALLSGRDEVIQLVQLLTVCRFLERMADQASNIAEDVIYLVEGQIVRHWRKEELYSRPHERPKE
jgi:phosphate transport system protein